MYEFCTDYEKMFENIVASAYTHIAAQKVKSLVIGMSGGIDSTLTAALAWETLARLDGHKTKLIGRVIDIESDPEEMKRAVKAMNAFCHGHGYHEMTDFYKDAVQEIMWVGSNSDSMKDRIRRGNIKARLRMIKLYDLANSLDGMVLSTDNYTEYLLGFWTLHGDVGDFGMIQNLWKTEVYGLAEYLMKRYNRLKMYKFADSLKECVDAIPTDGLGVTDSDFDQIYPDHDRNLSPAQIYYKVDLALRHRHAMQYKDHTAVKRWNATTFKRNNPFNIPREYIVK